MIFYYSSGGALMCDEAIAGVTQDLSARSYYEPGWYDGLRYFVAEGMSHEAARQIAHALGGTLLEMMPPGRQLVGATVDIRQELSRHAMYGVHSRKPRGDI